MEAGAAEMRAGLLQGAGWQTGSAQLRILGLAGRSWRQEEDTKAGGELAPEERPHPLPRVSASWSSQLPGRKASRESILGLP